jgi:hypothetical protein
MTNLKEQHICIKFCFTLCAPQTFAMLKVAFRERKLGRTQVVGWFCKFKSYVTADEGTKYWGHQSVSKQMKRVD